jgi:hypothetical protein
VTATRFLLLSIPSRLEGCDVVRPDVTYDLGDFGHGSLHGTAEMREAALALGSANPVGHHVANVVINEIDDRSARVQSKGIGVKADGTADSVVYDDIVMILAAAAAMGHDM